MTGVAYIHGAISGGGLIISGLTVANANSRLLEIFRLVYVDPFISFPLSIFASINCCCLLSPLKILIKLAFQKILS